MKIEIGPFRLSVNPFTFLFGSGLVLGIVYILAVEL